MDQKTDAPLLEPTWSRREFIGGLTGLGIAGLVAIFGKSALVTATRELVGSPVSSGLIHLYALDYYYVPNYMTWRVGDQLEVIFHNQSPTHWHEWTIGRPHANMEDFPAFGVLNADGWVHDFWTGVHVTLSDPIGVDNFVPNKAIVTYIGPKASYQLATGGDFSPTLKPGGSIHLSFVVPDKPGIWHYGCFVQQFIHYRTGMRGILHIVR
ncbi:MAG: hypothetical protein OWU33_03420 [Firmicutes bacterium]|nr:hypothetical protein [Bacillota bacterium]